MLIGIDIGTHAARVATLDVNGQPHLLSSSNANPIMPAVVRYTMHGAEAGEYSARFLVSNWENSVRGCTRLLARYADLPEHVLQTSPFPIINNNGQVQLDLLYAEVSPEEVYATIVGALKRQAEAALGQIVTETVITVPASAEDRYRVLVRQAAESQGLIVRRLVNQPTAALLALRHLMPSALAAQRPVAVVDVGGGTTDVSIAQVDGDAVRILATAGDGLLGSHDMARRVATSLDARLRSQAGRSLLDDDGTSKVAALGLLHASEEALETLAFAPEATIILDHGAGFGRDLFTTLRRDEASAWLEPELQRIAALCQRALQQSGRNTQAIAAVLLIGGGGQLPGVRRTVAQAFGRYAGDVLVHEPLALAAYGAALLGANNAAAVWDVTPFPLGINCFYGDEELFSPIIRANTPIPTPSLGQTGAFSDNFTTRFPGQTSVKLQVLQYRGSKEAATHGSERVFPHECEQLGEWSFDGLHPPRGGHAPFTVTFAVDSDGILTLLAEEVATGHRLTGRVERSL